MTSRDENDWLRRFPRPGPQETAWADPHTLKKVDLTSSIRTSEHRDHNNATFTAGGIQSLGLRSNPSI